jgi:hypothetical protein
VRNPRITFEVEIDAAEFYLDELADLPRCEDPIFCALNFGTSLLSLTAIDRGDDEVAAHPRTFRGAVRRVRVEDERQRKSE